MGPIVVSVFHYVNVTFDSVVEGIHIDRNGMLFEMKCTANINVNQTHGAIKRKTVRIHLSFYFTSAQLVVFIVQITYIKKKNITF